ncbi:MAG: M23 family metallopeptidase [Deltaproteobacteria bacterium]|jgi:murein DD-endopeptidase|nr:M23 family metallopeptidase [Deltaproteobacteria bacterium]
MNRTGTRQLWLRLTLAAAAGLSLWACNADAPAAPPAPDATTTSTQTVTRTTTTAQIPEVPTGPRYLDVRITSSLEAALTEATDPKAGPQLAQVAKRVLVWWMDVSRDFRKNDRLELVYELRDDQEPVIHAIWLESQKMGRPRSAIRSQIAGEPFPRWYEEDGSEVELRLKHSPIEGYEQITSLLKDGRRHKGVDFKAPVGTPVVAPFDGVVGRKNWSFRGNGNCVELLENKTGRNALFLHLANIDPKIQPGTKVRRGQVIGQAGNTGRSTAPHLHYQLEQKGRVLDPFDIHPTWKKRLAPADASQVLEQLAGFARLRAGST